MRKGIVRNGVRRRRKCSGTSCKADESLFIHSIEADGHIFILENNW